MASRRAPPWTRNFLFRASYFAGNAIFLIILYTEDTSMLYIQRRGRDHGTDVDSAVEVVLWAAAFLSWIAYLSVQGSSPGYLEPGQAEHDLPHVDAAGVHLDVRPEAGGRDKVAHGEAGEADSDDGGDHRHFGSSASSFAQEAGRAPPPARSRGAATGGAGAAPNRASPPPPSSSASASAAAAPPGAPLADEADSTSLLQQLEAPELPDYDPEHAPDPVGVAREAAADAERGWRDCRQCHARQPARAHHCRACGRCVPLFDHHCGVINTCIGERNRARFWAFLGAQSLALAVAIGILNTSFVWRRGTGEWVSANAGPIVYLVVLWLLQAFVFGLFVFHTWLACTNTTTYETSVGAQKLWYLAGTEPRDCDLPFSRGVATNLRLFCCVLDACCVPLCLRRAWRAVSGRGSGAGDEWRPHEWERAERVEREGDVCSNVWENRMWSCC